MTLDQLTTETRKALILSSKFEGSDTWANITGPFDGTGLTCGALGWTIKWDNQDPLVKEFLTKYGNARALDLMPKTWNEYWAVINDPEDTALRIVTGWGSGANVREPYLTELRNFWSSPEMQEIQVEFAQKQMGTYAAQMTDNFCKNFGIPWQEKVFCWYFDVAVNNGGMKGVQTAAGNGFAFSSLEAWANNLYVPVAYEKTKKDLIANLDIWRAKWDSMAIWEKSLVGLAVARSSLCVQDFKADVMNRKGSLAFGAGIVHGDHYEFSFTTDTTPVVTPPAMTPDNLSILENLATRTGIVPALMQHFQMFDEHLAARYYALVDMSLPSTKERLFIYDTQLQAVKTYLVSHGAGSAKKTDQEVVQKLSNIPGSFCTPVGMLKAGELHHGYMDLLGAEPVTDNVSGRGINLHIQPFDYQKNEIPMSKGSLGVLPEKFMEIAAQLPVGTLIWIMPL